MRISEDASGLGNSGLSCESLNPIAPFKPYLNLLSHRNTPPAQTLAGFRGASDGAEEITSGLGMRLSGWFLNPKPYTLAWGSLFEGFLEDFGEGGTKLDQPECHETQLSALALPSGFRERTPGQGLGFRVVVVHP